MSKVSQKELEAAFNETFGVDRCTTPDTGSYHVGLEVTLSGRKAHGGKLHTVTHVAKTISHTQAIIEAQRKAREEGVVQGVVLLSVESKCINYTKCPRA